MRWAMLIIAARELGDASRRVYAPAEVTAALAFVVQARATIIGRDTFRRRSALEALRGQRGQKVRLGEAGGKGLIEPLTKEFLVRLRFRIRQILQKHGQRRFRPEPDEAQTESESKENQGRETQDDRQLEAGGARSGCHGGTKYHFSLIQATVL